MGFTHEVDGLTVEIGDPHIEQGSMERTWTVSDGEEVLAHGEGLLATATQDALTTTERLIKERAAA